MSNDAAYIAEVAQCIKQLRPEIPYVEAGMASIPKEYHDEIRRIKALTEFTPVDIAPAKSIMSGLQKDALTLRRGLFRGEHPRNKVPVNVNERQPTPIKQHDAAGRSILAVERLGSIVTTIEKSLKDIAAL